MFHFLWERFVISNPPTRTLIHLTLSKTKLTDLKHDEFLEEDSLLSFCTADLSPFKPVEFLQNNGKKQPTISISKKPSQPFWGTYVVFADYLNTVCCYIKIWNPKNNLTKRTNKNTPRLCLSEACRREGAFEVGISTGGGSFQAWCYTWMSQKVILQ